MERSLRKATFIMARQFEELSTRDNDTEENQKNVIKVIKENLTDINLKMILTEIVIKDLTATLVQMSVLDRRGTKAHSVMDNETKQLWPQGYFVLMATSESCTVSDIWFYGYYKHHTESPDVNHDQFSFNNHFFQTVTEKYNNQNFIYQHVCIKISLIWNCFWLNGSYCIK